MKITTEINAPFGIIPALRASLIRRWAIIDMAREQSVAEHSFNVAMIARKIAETMGFSEEAVNKIMVRALDHDWPEEIYTGDVPSPCKERHSDINTEDIVKVADMIESLRFFKKNNNESIWEISAWVTKSIYAPLMATTESYSGELKELINSLIMGE